MSPDQSIAALTSHVRMALRAESIVLEAGLSRAARRTGLVAFAGLIAVFGLAAFDAAAFFALAPVWGNAWAMAAVGLGDFAIAAVVFAMASRDTKTRQLEIAEEMRDQAVEAVELDVKLAANAFQQLARNPMELVSGPILSLLVSLLTGFLKSRRERREG